MTDELFMQQAIAAGMILRATPKNIHPIPAAAYPMPAPRPTNSRLDTRLLCRTFDLDLPAWQSGVETVLRSLT